MFCDVSVFTGLYRQKSQGALWRVYSIIDRCHIAVILQYIVMLQCSPKCGGKTDKTRKVHCVLYCSVVYCDVAVFTGVWRQVPQDPQGALCVVVYFDVL